MLSGESISNVLKHFTHVVMLALAKTFKRKELNVKVLKSLNRTWQPKSTTILESKDLTTMAIATLFGKLWVYELELGRLKDEEEVDKKKKKVILKDKHFTSWS